MCLFLQLCIQYRTTRVLYEDHRNQVTLVSDDQIPLCLPTVGIMICATTCCQNLVVQVLRMAIPLNIIHVGDSVQIA